MSARERNEPTLWGMTRDEAFVFVQKGRDKESRPIAPYTRLWVRRDWDDGQPITIVSVTYAGIQLVALHPNGNYEIYARWMSPAVRDRLSRALPSRWYVHCVGRANEWLVSTPYYRRGHYNGHGVPLFRRIALTINRFGRALTGLQPHEIAANAKRAAAKRRRLLERAARRRRMIAKREYERLKVKRERFRVEMMAMARTRMPLGSAKTESFLRAMLHYYGPDTLHILTFNVQKARIEPVTDRRIELVALAINRYARHYVYV